MHTNDVLVVLIIITLINYFIVWMSMCFTFHLCLYKDRLFSIFLKVIQRTDVGRIKSALIRNIFFSSFFRSVRSQEPIQ
jgi:hypothetical protein